MLKASLSVPQWLSIPHETRVVIAQELNLKKSAGRIVDDNVVKSDGHTWEDLQAINTEALQAYLNSTETEFYRLVDALVVKLTPKTEVKQKVDLTQQHLERWRLNLEEFNRQAKNLGLESEFVALLTSLVPKSHVQPVQAKATEKVEGGKKRGKSSTRDSKN